jgi:acetyl/propionyl-CoA carboxylase alpha subunit
MLTCSDPLIAKVMVHASERNGACKKMTRVLSEAKLQGPPTNLHFLRNVVASTCNFSIISSEKFVLLANSLCSLPRRGYFDEFS